MNGAEISVGSVMVATVVIRQSFMLKASSPS
jgi:hypothetical protein